MTERMQDKSLYIKTVGIREWGNKSAKFNRYEATPYEALDKLFITYKIDKGDRLIDFGCGRGRVIFYIHNRFHIPVTGIEVNDVTFSEALENKKWYRYNNKDIRAPIKLESYLAQEYQINPSDNIFYFFNPFKIGIFKAVVNNILASVKEYERGVDIILYYPMPEYKKFLNEETPFRLIDKIRIPGAHDNMEKFLIYRI